MPNNINSIINLYIKYDLVLINHGVRFGIRKEFTIDKVLPLSVRIN